MKKYEFTGETMQFEGRTLHRIRCIKNISLFLKSGEIGGWIEHEGNLSHFGKCMVFQDAKVYGNAKVIENAEVLQDSIVKDNALIKGNSQIRWNSIVGADTIVDNSLIKGDSKVFFYKNASSDNRSNISGDSVIADSTIESTGFIHNTWLTDRKISGFLNLENEQM